MSGTTLKLKTRVLNLDRLNLAPDFRYAHLKRDGNFVTLVKAPITGALTVFSSGGKDITAGCRPFAWYQIAARRMPYGSSVCGEVSAIRRDFECDASGSASYLLPAAKVRSFLALAKEGRMNGNIATRDDEWGGRFTLIFEAFACPSMPHDIGLLDLDIELSSMGFVTLPHIHAWENVIDVFQTIEEFLTGKDNYSARFEGLVFKNGNCLDWYKWKPTKTIDAIVTGWTEGEGKFFGLPGSLRLSVWRYDTVNQDWDLVDIGTAGGMADEVRHEINVYGAMHRVAEIEYQNVTENFKLRHGRFKCWRDDKPAESCTFDQFGV